MIKRIYKKENKDKSLEEKVFEFFVNNPFPKDEMIHSFADELGIEHSKFEEEVYKLVSTFIAGGKSKGKPVNESPEEEAAGIETEYEHVLIDSPYAKLIARKINWDHEAEFPDNYYLKGIDLVNQEKKVSGKNND